jgi:hypothetical protein
MVGEELMKPQKLTYITRAIDNDGVHHLDAIDEQGRHWYASMQQREESWLTYVQHWTLKLQ